MIKDDGKAAPAKPPAVPKIAAGPPKKDADKKAPGMPKDAGKAPVLDKKEAAKQALKDKENMKDILEMLNDIADDEELKYIAEAGLNMDTRKVTKGVTDLLRKVAEEAKLDNKPELVQLAQKTAAALDMGLKLHLRTKAVYVIKSEYQVSPVKATAMVMAMLVTEEGEVDPEKKHLQSVLEVRNRAMPTHDSKRDFMDNEEELDLLEDLASGDAFPDRAAVVYQMEELVKKPHVWTSYSKLALKQLGTKGWILNNSVVKAVPKTIMTLALLYSEFYIGFTKVMFFLSDLPNQIQMLIDKCKEKSQDKDEGEAKTPKTDEKEQKKKATEAAKGKDAKKETDEEKRMRVIGELLDEIEGEQMSVVNYFKQLGSRIAAIWTDRLDKGTMKKADASTRKTKCETELSDKLGMTKEQARRITATMTVEERKKVALTGNVDLDKTLQLADRHNVKVNKDKAKESIVSLQKFRTQKDIEDGLDFNERDKKFGLADAMSPQQNKNRSLKPCRRNRT